MRLGFQFTALTAAAFGLCLTIARAAEGAKSPVRLDVLLYDEVGVPPLVAAKARAVAARIFNRIAVHISWHDAEDARICPESETPEQRALLKSLYTVRLVAAAGSWQPNVPSASALGFAIPGARVASVFYPRVVQLGTEREAEVAVVLGHVIAHELGHLLLQQGTHSATGLMQAVFNPLSAAQGRLDFADDQVRAIRRNLNAY